MQGHLVRETECPAHMEASYGDLALWAQGRVGNRPVACVAARQRCSRENEGTMSSHRAQRNKGHGRCQLTLVAGALNARPSECSWASARQGEDGASRAVTCQRERRPFSHSPAGMPAASHKREAGLQSERNDVVDRPPTATCHIRYATLLAMGETYLVLKLCAPLLGRS